MAEIMQFKCPSCGGAIEFDSDTQKMKCPFCDAELEIDSLKEYEQELENEQADEMEWQTRPGSEWSDEEAEKLHSYVCNSCGGEIVCDETTAATSCPFCGSPTVITDRLTGTPRPDFVIPFKLDKDAAKEALRRHMTGKRLLPKAFRDESRIDKIRGVYVPFWLFDADVSASVRYRATKTRFWSSRDYNYTETSFFSVLRGGNVRFMHIPVDGSSKMADDLMESIEPYDFSGAVDFRTAYLSGFLADKYDIDSERSIERANMRIKQSTESAFYSTVQGYTSVNAQNSSIRLSNSSAKYALYPVWLLNTVWEGQTYTFAMNGQTGKFVGDLPVDKKASRLWTLGLTVLCGAIIYGGAWLLRLAGIL